MHTGRVFFHGPFALFLLLFDFYDFAAFVVPASGANRVRQAHFAAVRALHQIDCLESVMGAAAIAAALRVFPFWMWGHVLLLAFDSFHLRPQQCTG